MEWAEGKEENGAKLEGNRVREGEEDSAVSFGGNGVQVRKSDNHTTEVTNGRRDCGSGDLEKEGDCADDTKNDVGLGPRRLQTTYLTDYLDKTKGTLKKADKPASEEAEFVDETSNGDFGPRVSPEGSDETEPITQIVVQGRLYGHQRQVFFLILVAYSR